MIIIDLEKKQINESPLKLDPTVIVLKGCTPEFIVSMTKLARQVNPQLLDTVNILPANNKKVGLGYKEKISSTVPQSIKANGDGNFDEVYQQLVKRFDNWSKKTTDEENEVKDEVPQASIDTTLDRQTLQEELGEVLIDDAKLVETVRKAVSESLAINPESNKITTKNIKVGLALLAYFSDGAYFGIAEAVETIASLIEVSEDTLYHMTDLDILWEGTEHQYRVGHAFANLVLDTLEEAKFESISQEVERLQRDINNSVS